jgi:diketogulonate reductase-like aldo/keto reductase
VDLFLIHWPVAFKRGEEKFPKGADGKPATEQIDYLDVCRSLPPQLGLLSSILYFAANANKMLQTYKALEKLVSSGKVKAIGVSNFSQEEIQRVVDNATVPPSVHQLEGHPWLQQRSFADWHKKNGIHVTHYSPFGNQNELYSREGKIGRLIEDPTLVEIGKKYNKSGAQVALGMFPPFLLFLLFYRVLSVVCINDEQHGQ